jgi:hypothetical protein
LLKGEEKDAITVTNNIEEGCSYGISRRSDQAKSEKTGNLL